MSRRRQTLSSLTRCLLTGTTTLLACLADLAQAQVAGPASDPGYYTFTIEEHRLTGAPDKSALNQPLGPADQVFVQGRHFYTVGPDQIPGTPDDKRIRFFGVNLSFAANFPAQNQAQAMAARLRKLGINAVRLHHLDTMAVDETNPPRSVLSTGPYPSFNPVAIDRLKTFVEALSENGIYINLNLRVGYRFRPDIDGLPPLDNQQSRPASVGTPIHVYYPELIERQERYAQELIRRLGLVDNPALAMVEINNESSLLAAWQGDAWYGDTWHNAIPSAYAPELRKHWDAWIEQRYGSIKNACAAWDNCDDPDSAALPATTISGATSATPSVAERIANRLTRLGKDLGLKADDPDHPDPVQIYRYDFLSFLASMDSRYLNRMKSVIKTATGTPVPVTGTQMTYGGILNLDSHREMDYIDDHVYVGHHVYANGNPWQSTDWRVQEMSASGKGMTRLLGLALRRDNAKPFVVSEFNQPFPTPGGAEILPVMVAVASLQDWDGLFFYRYDDTLDRKEAPWYFSLSGDWGKYALTAQSARAFREFRIPALQRITALPLTPKDRLYLVTQGHIRTGPLERHLETRFGLSLQHAWSDQLAQDVLFDNRPSDPSVPARKPTESPASGRPSAHARHDANRERLLIDTPMYWGVAGKMNADEVLQVGPLALRLASPPAQSVQILVTPEDGLPLAESSRLLVSLGSDTTGTQPGSIPSRPKALIPYPGQPGWLTLEPDPLGKARSAMLSAQAPSWLKRTPVGLRLPHDASRITVYPLNGKGQRRQPLPPEALHAGPEAGFTWVTLHDQAQTASPWYEVVIRPAPRPRPSETQ